jgi:nitroreductase
LASSHIHSGILNRTEIGNSVTRKQKIEGISVSPIPPATTHRRCFAQYEPDEFAEALYGQSAPKTAAFSVAFVFDLARYCWIYRHERALRNLFVEVGRIAQYLIIAGEQLGWSALPTPAIADSKMANLLGCGSERFYPAYTLTVG